MNVRNRMADVNKLRCNACQDFLRLIIKDGWQNEIYETAFSEIQKHTKLGEKLLPLYEKMREIGVENYSIDEMDVTLVSAVVHKCKKLAPTEVKTRIYLERVTVDRNIYDHSNENEEDEELYLRGLLELCDLRAFVKTVDKYELSISDENRQKYNAEYAFKIKELKNLLDEERIELIQNQKRVESDIERILACEDEESRNKAWGDTYKLYFERYWNIEDERDKYIEFVIAASDAGIPNAHACAIDIFSVLKKDYDEVENRLLKMYKAYENKMCAYEARTMIETINELLSHGKELSSSIDKIVKKIISLGYPVKSKDGYYQWIDRKKNRLH